MAANPVPPPPQGFWDKYRHDILVIIIAVILSAILILGIYHLFLTLPDPNIGNAAQKDVAQLIFIDAYWFHELYMRWTVVDWLLTFLATGTAISAVIRNSVSAKSGAATELSKWDILLIILALFAVLASAFDAKLHAGILAEKYRQGDLILQGAKIDYSASDKGQVAKDALRQKWHEAQNILASSAQAYQKPPDTKPGDKATPSATTPVP